MAAWQRPAAWIGDAREMALARPRPGDFGPLVAVSLACVLAGAAATLTLYRLPLPIAIGVLLAPAVIATIAWRPVFGIYAGMLTLPLGAFGVEIGSFDSSLSELIFLVTGVVAFFPVLVVGGGWRSLRPAHLWFAALIALSALGFFFAPSTGDVTFAVRSACSILVLSVLVSTLDRRELERLLIVFAASGGIVGVVAMLTTGEQQAQVGSADVAGRASTGFAHPNVLGFYLQLTLGPALALMADRRWWARILMGAAVVGIIGGLVLTLSRSSIVGAAVVLLVLMASSRFRRTAAVVLGVVAVAALVNINSLSQSSEVTLLQQRLSTVSVSGAERDPRYAIWRETPTIVVEHFVLGIGQGNFHVAANAHGLVDPTGVGYNHAHSLLLTVAAETGLLGLAIFIGFMVAVTSVAVRTLKARGPSRRILLGVVASLGGLFVTSVVEYPPRTQAILAVVMILVGALLAYERLELREASGRRASRLARD